MNTFIIYDDDGLIIRCFRQDPEPELRDGESLLIDNSIEQVSKVNWRAKQVVDGVVVDRVGYVKDVEPATRARRDRELTATDWTQISDNGLSDSNRLAWTTYRQSLRDLPSHANWPNLNDDDWPDLPQ